MSPKVKQDSADETAAERPQDWRDYFGLQATVGSLQNLARARRLPPVMLFYGRPGVGKRAVAAQTAAMVWCETGDGCGHCDACRWLLAGEQTDLLWVDPLETSLPVTTAAAIQDHLATRGQGGGARVVVVCNAERLTVQAANRLLKVLEEPPAGAYLILTTDRRRGLLPTILSRCVPWQVQPPAAAETMAWLRQMAQAEDLVGPQDETAWQELLRRGALAPGLCLQILRQYQEQAQRLWAAPQRAQEILEHVEQVVPRGQGAASASELVRTWEMDLNEDYRRQVAGSQTQPAAPLRSRRRLLRRIKQLAGRGRIALNSQLAAEALLLRSQGLVSDSEAT